MNNTSRNIFSTNIESDQPTFNVIVLYEDKLAGHHAKRACDHIFERLENSLDCRLQMYSFDALTIESVRTQSASESIDAQLVILSAGRTGNVPPEIQTWLESAENRRKSPVSLAVLTPDDDGVLPPGWETLHNDLLLRSATNRIRLVGKKPSRPPFPAGRSRRIPAGMTGKRD